MKKVLLVIGIIVLLLAAAAVALLIVLSKMPAVPEDYTETVPTGENWRRPISPWAPARWAIMRAAA